HLNSFDKILWIKFIRSNHSMQTKTLYSKLFCLLVSSKKLLLRKTELRILRLADNYISGAKRPRVITKTDQLRQTTLLMQIIEMRNIIEINNRSKIDRLLIFLRRSFVGGKHYRLATYPYPL